MKLYSSILAGLIQGLTEFLPVSSSGHLALWQALTGAAEDPVAFEILLHLGTLIAVFIVYFRDIVKLVPAAFRWLGKLFHGKFRWRDWNEDEHIVVLLLVGTLFLVPGAILSDLLSPYIPGGTVLVGILLLLNGAMLFSSDYLRGGGRRCEDLTPGDGVKIGIAQLIAVFPGISRSGMTMTAGRWCGLASEEAVRYSFLLSIPAIGGACVWKLPKLFSDIPDLRTWLVYLAGMLCAGLVGFCAMKLLKLIAAKRGFRGFGIYCFLIGAAAILYGILC